MDGNAWGSLQELDRRRDPIELVETVVGVQAERLALNFEVPPVPHGTPSDLPILRDFG
jgi:hypothetical protein